VAQNDTINDRLSDAPAALRIGVAVVLSLGGIIGIRRIIAERTALAAEQERSRRLTDLTVFKANFTAMIAHELTNPLAAIRGYSEMMQTRELTSEDQAYALNVIRTESNTMITLVNDLRSAATAERDDFAVQLAPISPNVLIANAVTFARTLPGSHPITTTVETSTRVLADVVRIGQVLRNLLTNAAHFSADGSPIQIRVTEQGAWVRIAIIDQGVGIASADMAKIFTKFGRGRDQDGKKVLGASLGLYLARRILRAHGAELIVASTSGIGSEFAFDLEAAR
jgi:signal transduction histidine kinase